MIFNQYFVVSYKSATISLLTEESGRITIMFDDDPFNKNVRNDGLALVNKLFRLYTSTSVKEAFMAKYMKIHEGSGVRNYRFIIDHGEKKLWQEIEKKRCCYIKIHP